MSFIENNSGKFETNPEQGNLGLNQLLSSPDNIAGLSLAPEIQDKLSPEIWAGVYKIVSVLVPLFQASIELDKNSNDKIYTLEMGTDNGVLLAYRNKTDSTQTTTIYVSSHGKELSDWGYGGRIKPDRVLCHSIKIVSRKEIAPQIYTASEFRFRVSPDFSLVEGDPKHRRELLDAGLFSDNKTFLFNTNTRYHLTFIEMVDTMQNKKYPAPLVTDIKNFYKLVLDSQRGDFLRNLLSGKLTDQDISRLAKLFAESGSTSDIDLDNFFKFGKEIVKDLIAQTESTMRLVSISKKYLDDLQLNLQKSAPSEIELEVLLPQTSDAMGIQEKRFLQKRADKKLGRWQEVGPRFM